MTTRNSVAAFDGDAGYGGHTGGVASQIEFRRREKVLGRLLSICVGLSYREIDERCLTSATDGTTHVAWFQRQPFEAYLAEQQQALIHQTKKVLSRYEGKITSTKKHT
ncbi:uncharacterized protein RSE6_01995 [Rhynchosporium secalis]|uniref:Uncharacterized protein n=1 Tax=Rhynchosporium secalis TaxID=38038 RepID=A0A1E1LZ51_RHYSE|nr:uncharacterized protein RSE6_01995 [Rhynchosporium secalis]